MPTASRDVLYVYDDALPTTGERRRIYLIPSGTTDIDLVGPIPEWGDDPAEGSGVIRLPRGVLEFAEGGDVSYEKLPVGLHNTPTFKVILRYDIAAELPGLAAVIDQYTAQVSIEGTFGTGNTYEVVAANLWTVMGDGGNGALSVFEFATIFQGCQRRLPSYKGKIIPRVRATEELELYHVARAITDTVTMAMACTEAANTTTVTAKVVHDLIWEDGDGNHWIWGARETLGTARLALLSNLFVAIEGLCSDLYAKLIRGGFFATPAFQLRRPADSLQRGTPYSHIIFSRQGYTADLAKPAGENLDSQSDLYVIATITLDDGAKVAGLFVAPSDKDTNADTLATDATVYETLGKMCEGTLCKAKFHQVDETHVDLWFLPVFDGLDDAHDITLEDIDYPEYDEEGGIDYERSASVCANAQATIRSTGSFDETSAEAKAFGGAGEQGMAAEILVNNMPGGGDGENTKDWKYGTDSNVPSGRGFVRFVYDPWKIYCLDTVFGGSTPVVIRVHHSCTINLGAGQTVETGHTSPISLTGFPLAGTGNDEGTINAIRAAIITIQHEGGMLNGIPNAYCNLFGNPRQTAYTLKLPTATASYNAIGEAFNLAPADGDGNHTANALLDVPSIDLAERYGRCILTAVKPYADPESSENLSECTLLGIGY